MSDENSPLIPRWLKVSLPIVLIVLIVIWWIVGRLPMWWYPDSCNDHLTAGTFGDMFGMVNSLFSVFAFAGALATLFLQTIELRENRKEYINMVKAQLKSANISLLAAKFNSLESLKDSMIQLLSSDSIRVAQFVEARNKLRDATRLISESINKEHWSDSITFTNYEFPDDILAYAIQDLIDLNTSLSLPDYYRGKDQDERIENQILLRRSIINSVQSINRAMRTLHFNKDHAFLFMNEFRIDANQFIIDSQAILDDLAASTPDSAARDLTADGRPMLIFNGQHWEKVIDTSCRVLRIYKKNCITWAKLGSV